MYNRRLCEYCSRVLATVKIAASAVPTQTTTCYTLSAPLVVAVVPNGAIKTYIELLRRDVIDPTRGVARGLSGRSGAEIHRGN